jgi:hypothetical protein
VGRDARGEKIERPLDALRQEMWKNTRWLVSLQVATMLVALGAALAR